MIESPQGYKVTRVGQEIFDEAIKLEESIQTVERRIAGKDSELSGEIRITLPELLGNHLLMDDLADFLPKLSRY